MAFDLNKGGKKPDFASAKPAEVQSRSWLLPVLGGVLLIAVAGWYFLGRSDSGAAGTPPATQAPAASNPAATAAGQQGTAPAPTKDSGAAQATAAPAPGTPPPTPTPAGTPAATNPATASGQPTGRAPGSPSSAPVAGKASEPSTAANASTPTAGSSATEKPAPASGVKSSPGAITKPAGSSVTERPAGNASATTAASMIPVRFEPLSSSVTAADDAVVGKILKYLTEHPGAKVTVKGYASSDGDLAMNVALSTKRAEAFKSYLVGKGAAAERIVAVGKGIDDPIASNDTQPGRAQNRRVEVIY
jgi:outer membrane protein OmpA-like peptidoglycan-associated protein